MNQNICPNCRTLNTPDKSFCVTCGRPLAVAPPGYQGNFPPNQYGGAPNAQGYNQTPAPKKSNLGLWLGILGGLAVLVILIGGAGLVGLYFYLNSGKSSTDYSYNSSNTSPSNSSTDSNSLANNKTIVDAPMTEDEKYRLFYAASKVGDQALTMKISKKIGIIDEKNMPTAYYKTFTAGMIKWAMRDTDFVRKVDTKQKAIEYINSVMPGAATSSSSSPSSTSSSVSLGVINGKATNLVTPAYPAAARAVRASGTVNVQVNLDEAGNVTYASSVSGHPLLRQAAEQAARESKFSPAVINGQASRASGIVVYNFEVQ